MLIVSVIINILLVGVIYFKNIKYSDLKDKYDTDELSLLECETIVRRKNVIISSLKKEIQSLYKTIDEFTSEKAELSCDAEVTEKTLKRKRK